MSKNATQQQVGQKKENMIFNFKVKPKNSLVVTMWEHPDANNNNQNAPSTQQQQTNQPPQQPSTQQTQPIDVWHFHDESFDAHHRNNQRFVPPGMEKFRSTPLMNVNTNNREMLLHQTKHNSAPNILHNNNNTPIPISPKPPNGSQLPTRVPIAPHPSYNHLCSHNQPQYNTPHHHHHPSLHTNSQFITQPNSAPHFPTNNQQPLCYFSNQTNQTPFIPPHNTAFNNNSFNAHPHNNDYNQHLNHSNSGFLNNAKIQHNKNDVIEVEDDEEMTESCSNDSVDHNKMAISNLIL